MEKKCLRCSNMFDARGTAVYCPVCRKPAKAEREMQRYREDPEYRSRRQASVSAYDRRNKEKLAASRAAWRKANPEKCSGYSLKHHYANPEKMKLKREKQKLREYGLTVAQYAQMLEEQGGVCWICKNECCSRRKLAVDHDAESGRVRGLLCANCNRGIGLLKHDKDRLVAALEYLART